VSPGARFCKKCGTAIGPTKAAVSTTVSSPSDLPTPGSAIAATICPRPPLANSAVCLSASISRSRPTNFVSPRPTARCNRAQRPDAGHFINVDRLAGAFDFGRAQRLQSKVTLDQLARRLGHHDRPGACDALQARCEIGGMSDGRVFDLSRTGRDRADHGYSSSSM
jgi:hypothetical protein